MAQDWWRVKSPGTADCRGGDIGVSTLMAIRKAHPGDLAGIRSCADEAYAPYVAVIGRKPAPMIADFGAHIRDGAVHVACDPQGGIDGFIVFFPRSGHMFLENVAVRGAARGRGVGGSLVAFCVREALRLNLPLVELYTNEKMTGNLSLYPRLGYIETGRRREDGFDRVYFRKHLT